jgi:hypothetical protein
VIQIHLLPLPVADRQLVTLTASLFIFNDAPKLRFHLRRQKKVTQEKATPVCRATLQVAYPSFRNRSFSSVVSWECPCGIVSQQIAGLRNSPDSLKTTQYSVGSANFRVICFAETVAMLCIATRFRLKTPLFADYLRRRAGAWGGAECTLFHSLTRAQSVLFKQRGQPLIFQQQFSRS